MKSKSLLVMVVSLAFSVSALFAGHHESNANAC